MSRQPEVPSPLINPAFLGHRQLRAVRVVLTTAAFLLAAPQVGLGASSALTGQFQINTVTGSYQSLPVVASDAAGNFVVCWESYTSGGNDNDGRSIQCRRYNPAGTAIGSQFQVNTSITYSQTKPAVAMNPSGSFVVVWESNHADFYNSNIIAQRYTAAGSKVGSELLVNSAFTAGIQGVPAVAMADNGDFVVVWRSSGGAGGDPGISIQGRRWRASNSSFFDQFLVNDVTAGDQDDPAIATDGISLYLVAWEYPGDIAIRYFTADNLAVAVGMTANAPQQTANTFPSAVQSEPAVAMTPGGRAVVAWETFAGSFGTDNARLSIQARRLAANGTFLDANDVQINTYITDDQRFPSLAMDASGIFVASWQSYGSEVGNDTDFSVQFRAFDVAGHALDPIDVQANSYTAGYQWYSAVAFGSNGRLLVVWESNGSPGTDQDGFSIQGRLYDVGVFIFADGFETGNTSRWSAVAQ